MSVTWGRAADTQEVLGKIMQAYRSPKPSARELIDRQPAKLLPLQPDDVAKVNAEVEELRTIIEK